MTQKVSGELIFLRYAFPVIRYCNRTTVTTDEIAKFEEMLKSGEPPSRQRLEEIFPNAVKKLKTWTPEDVRDYWLREHNKIVKGNPLCAVYLFSVSKVLSAKDKEVCRVNLSGLGTLNVKSYIPLKEKDKVTVHGFQVAEILSQENIDKYFRE